MVQLEQAFRIKPWIPSLMLEFIRIVVLQDRKIYSSWFRMGLILLSLIRESFENIYFLWKLENTGPIQQHAFLTGFGGGGGLSISLIYPFPNSPSSKRKGEVMVNQQHGRLGIVETSSVHYPCFQKQNERQSTHAESHSGAMEISWTWFLVGCKTFLY